MNWKCLSMSTEMQDLEHQIQLVQLKYEDGKKKITSISKNLEEKNDQCSDLT